MSTVDFSERVFDNRRAWKCTVTNWDLMGGWVSKSPLTVKKLDAYGISSMQESLAADPSCLFVDRSDYDTEWLRNYYAQLGDSIEIQTVDVIGDGYFTVYEVTRRRERDGK